jgi:formate dehydrogenase major subunit
MEALDLLVVADPHPTTFSSLSDRKNNTYLLPICTSFETTGSRTASNRSLQWGEKVVEPIFESKDDYEAMYLLAKKLGFADQMFKNIKVENNRPSAEDILREINRGGWSTGYCGQSPERLQAHMRNQAKFDLVTLRAPKDDPEVGGDYYGLPWPCWGKPEIRHPGSPILYRTDVHVKEGGGTFRARFGVERNGQTLLAEDSYSKDSELVDGYPEFTMGILKKLGWDKDLTPEETATIARVGGNNIDAVSWAIDLSGGIQRVCLEHGVMHYGNGKARANAWNLPDPVPVHREPIYSPRPDLVAKYPTRPDERQFRIPNLGFSFQKAAVDNNVARDFPIILSSGRLVEYAGGGEETRSNPWLAELQQENFVEINTQDAADRGIRYWDHVWVRTPTGARLKLRAMVTERVGSGTTFVPYHFAGWWEGIDRLEKYPPGMAPIVRGEAVNTATTYGYDVVTMMQESKTTLCQVERA